MRLHYVLRGGVVVNPSIITINGVLLMKGLKHNLLSISQLYDKCYSIKFDSLNYIIEHKRDKDMMFKGSRIDHILYAKSR